MRASTILLVLLLFGFQKITAQELMPIQNFGENPGNLKMYIHLPPSANKVLPLVVVLHGCSQNAGMVAKQSGWNELANKYGFAVLYAQQKMSNNIGNCFCWYNANDVDKGKGENASITSMIEYTKAHYLIDSSKVFVTGLSAGAAMAVSMLATHPETFKAGAIFAGAPFNVASRFFTSLFAMQGWILKSPENWGKLVRAQNPNYQGFYPSIIVYQGKADAIVNKRNGYEIVKQWTNLQGIQPIPTQQIKRFAGKRFIEKNVYKNASLQDVVVYYKVKGLGHALMIDPGKCEMQGGKRKLFSTDKNYYSTYWTAVDFGLITPHTITGANTVNRFQQLTLSVPATEGTTYKWQIPKGCKSNNKNSNSISINWGKISGGVNVETKSQDGCKTVYQTKFIEVK
jgi:feruloyl esterase